MYAVTAFFIRVLYSVISTLFPTRKRITLLSRQSDTASLDFLMLKDCLQEHMPDWAIAESYQFRQTLFSVMHDVFLVATSRVCILDGYHPAVSIPKVKQDLLVIQLWHALGAIKRFGWQAVGLRTGRPEHMAKCLSMHANYTVVIAAGKGCIPAYTEAFRCSAESVVELGIPRMDYLLGTYKPTRYSSDQGEMGLEIPALTSSKINVLYVPTFREKQNDTEALRGFIEQLASSLPENKFNLLVRAHPFSSSWGKTDNSNRAIYTQSMQSIDLLGYVDYVLTDYSAIAFEAALVRKKVLFYIPDIDSYRDSPGFNIDVETEFPLISFRSAEELESFIDRDLRDNSYESTGFWKYCDNYLIKTPKGSTERIVKYICEKVL